MSKPKKINYNKYGYYFVAPFIVIFVLFQLYPIVKSLYLSLTDLSGWSTEGNMVYFRNFKYLLENKLFKESIKNTIIIWVVNFIPQLGFALLLAAWFTNVRINLKGKGLYKVLFYMPAILTTSAIAILYGQLFRYPSGPINNLLISINIINEPINFFRSVGWSRGIISFIQFWMFYGSTMIMLISAILGIDTTYYESAMIDGANDRKCFFKITMPLIKPIMLYILVTSLIGGLQIFDIPFLMTVGGPDNSTQTVAMYIYNQAFQGGRNFGVAAAASVIVLFIIIFFSNIIFKAFGEKEEKQYGKKHYKAN